MLPPFTPPPESLILRNRDGRDVEALRGTTPWPLGREARFTVFDVETTGLDPRQGHRILEIAGVRVEGGRILAESAFCAFVNPERAIPWDAKQVNNIRDEDVADADTIDTVLPAFLRFAEGSVLVAHNAGFDLSFLEREKECCWGYVDLPECLCTLKLSRLLFSHLPRHTLDAVGAHLRIPANGRLHRALPDVLLTAQIFVKMIQIGKIASLDELRRQAGLRQLVA